MNEEELGGGIMVSMPNILFEIEKTSSYVEKVTKEFYFFRTFWKFRIRCNEPKSRKTVVNMIVHKAPVNYTKLHFSVTCGILAGNEGDIFEPNVIRVSLEDLVTNRTSNVEIWAQDFSELDLRDQNVFPGLTLKFLCRVQVDSKLKDLKQLNEEQVMPSCAEYFGTEVKSLLDKSIITDVILKCGDKSIPAHKCILSCRSPVFRAMFQKDFKESQQGIVEITDIEPMVLQKLIDYVYSGNIDTTDECVESVCELYKAAHKYCMEPLKKRCVLFLKENLELQDACWVLIMSSFYENSNLKAYVVSYLAKRREFLLTEEWQMFAKQYVAIAQDVLLHYVSISELE